ncbi:adenosylcobinamide-GDP ribazoletransferase [Mesorhizobium sp. CAU 1741]|uniref:adenosylcobinamide-GDP ribazoletransferase n=1 Tax=Mesorhizobium sp. CAU 1741 TaxID=3140366 RepID=UPI00325A66CD
MALPAARMLLQDVGLCVGFFTRIPVTVTTSRGLAQAQWATPVAGGLIGLCIATAYIVVLSIGMPAGIAAALTLAAGALLTGALHEDGLGDVADGFGGGRTRDDKLAIMKDSRLGTYGALALMVSLLARWSAMVAIAPFGTSVILATLVAAHAASRALIPLFMAWLPSARPGGLADRAGAVDADVALAALAIGIALLLPTGIECALVCMALLACTVVAMRNLAMAQIGGQTGDVLGALQQAGEVGVLVVAATLLT